MDRRPLKSRDTSWAKNLAHFLAMSGIGPNLISIFSVVFSMLGFLSFFLAYDLDNPLFLIGAAVSIQLRLLCNLFDGMVAVEYNKKSAMGDVYNDLPDRIADVFFIMGAGYYCQDYFSAMTIAWLGSIGAVMTAYIRVLGSSIGTPSFFIGPMAKPHRMFALTLASILEVLFSFSSFNISFVYYALVLICLGSFITCARRLVEISRIKNKE